MESNTQTLLIVFVALTGLAVLLQACVLFGIFIALRRSAAAVQKATEDMKATIIPIAHTTRELVERLTPQVMAISAGISDLTDTIRKETAGVSFSVSEIMARVSHQSERIDTILTSGLNAVERAGGVVESTVALPVRQVNGIMAGLKAMVGTYMAVKPTRTRPTTENNSNY